MTDAELTDTDLLKIGYDALVETYARHPKRFTLRRRAIKILRRMLTERGISRTRSNFLIKCAEQQWAEASEPFIAKHKQSLRLNNHGKDLTSLS